MVWGVKVPDGSRPPHADLQMACTVPAPVVAIVVVGGTTLVVVAACAVVVVGAAVVVVGAAVVDDIGGIVVVVVVVVAAGTVVVELGGAVVDTDGVEGDPCGVRLPAATAGAEPPSEPLASQAQPAVIPAPTRPASSARKRRRGISEAVIGETLSASRTCAWQASGYLRATSARKSPRPRGLSRA